MTEVRQTLLVLAASQYQVDAIQTARRMGYRVVTTDNQPSNPGHALADVSYSADVTDRERVLAIAAQEQVTGILAFATDVAVPTRAFVAERLDLPGPPLHAAETVCDKVRMRRWLCEQGLPVPETRVINHWETDQLLHRYGGGKLAQGWWVLKPDRSSGAKGIRIVDSLEALLEHLPHTLRFSPSPEATALLERYVDGHQGTCEGILQGGEIVSAFFLDRQTVAPPYTTTSGHHVPTRLVPDLQREVLRQLSVVWQSLGVRSGPFDCDFVATPDTVYLLDLTPRVGGNSIARLLREAAGQDITRYAIQEACGEVVDRPPFAGQIRPTALVVLGVDRAGGLRYDEQALAVLRAEPWVLHVQLDLLSGAPVQPFINSRCRVGEALLVGETRDAVDQRADELKRRLALGVS